MNQAQLFVQSMDHLRQLVAAGDDYAMLQAAGILRKLILDGSSSLVHAVNRRHRVKFAFAVSGRHYTEVVLQNDPTFYCALDGIYPSSGPWKSEALKLDPFLATPVLKCGKQVFSVRDLISIAANVMGGVHAGEPRNDAERALVQFSEAVEVFGQPLHAAQLRPIVQIVIEALAPIERVVRHEISEV